jgi:hypothetical protein
VLALHVGDIRWAPGQVMPRPHEPDAMSRQLNPAQQARIRPGRAQWRRGWPSSVRDRARLS